MRRQYEQQSETDRSLRLFLADGEERRPYPQTLDGESNRYEHRCGKVVSNGNEGVGCGEEVEKEGLVKALEEIVERTQIRFDGSVR